MSSQENKARICTGTPHARELVGRARLTRPLNSAVLVHSWRRRTNAATSALQYNVCGCWWHGVCVTSRPGKPCLCLTFLDNDERKPHLEGEGSAIALPLAEEMKSH
jgi:hypothetical protein